MAKTDVRNAFRILPVNPYDYHLLGSQWKECSVLLRYVCPYGGKKLFFPFEKLSSGLEWIARTKLGPPHIIHILDDFMIIDKTLSVYNNRVQQFWRLCADIEVPMAPEKKTEGPAHVLTFAGIELDCSNWTRDQASPGQSR